MDDRRIIGVVLLKNEERFIAQVLRNIINFCDHIIVVDNYSTDDTPEIVKAIQRESKKIDYHRVKDPYISHDLISHYAGENVWIFGVDGDELYDPAGLAVMREKLTSGVFDKYWMVMGNVLNCIRVDDEKNTADGYLAPPCRSMTKLYNFAGIEAWPGPCSERLHGGKVEFKPGFTEKKRKYLHNEFTWEDSIFRCLHLCFISRSRLDLEKNGRIIPRKNIADKLAESYWDKSRVILRKLFGKEETSDWKKEKYMRGHLVTKMTQGFITFEEA